jgi:hypothetical protein
MLQVHVRDLNNWDVTRPTLERAMRRPDAIGLTILAALVLSVNDTGRHCELRKRTHRMRAVAAGNPFAWH